MTRSTGASSADRELADDRLLVQQLDAVERGQRLARVRGALQEQLAQLDDALAPEPRQVDDAAERVERLRGADVRRRLLAADVLLARLERQDEAALAVDVLRLAGDAAGHPPQVGLGRGEEAERRPAVVEPVAELLALADRDVDADTRPGGLRMPSVSGSTCADDDGRASPSRRALSASTSSTAPRKFGCWTKTALVSCRWRRPTRPGR